MSNISLAVLSDGVSRLLTSTVPLRDMDFCLSLAEMWQTQATDSGITERVFLLSEDEVGKQTLSSLWLGLRTLLSGFSMTIAIVALKLPPSNVLFFQSKLSIAKTCTIPWLRLTLCGTNTPSSSICCMMLVLCLVSWRCTGRQLITAAAPRVWLITASDLNRNMSD